LCYDVAIFREAGEKKRMNAYIQERSGWFGYALLACIAFARLPLFR